MVLKRGTCMTKSLFRSECEQPLRTNTLEALSGTIPYLTLYISTRMPWRCLLYKVGSLALCKSFSYVSKWDLYIALAARSRDRCIRSTFLLSHNLQKCHIKWQYIKCGKIKALYSNSLALNGIKFLKQDNIPTFWLILTHSTLISFLKSRSTAMWIPSCLMSSDLSRWVGHPRLALLHSYFHQCYFSWVNI